MKTINITVTPIPAPPRQLSIRRLSCIDNPNSKTVEAEVIDDNSGHIARFITWEGKEYDAIGNWTDEQADKRVEELLTEDKVREIFVI